MKMASSLLACRRALGFLRSLIRAPLLNPQHKISERSDYKRTWQSLATTPEQAKIFVSGRADEEYLDRMGEYTVELLERFVGIRPSDIVLEIGCGVGRVGKSLAPRCRKWIGTDISANMLKYAAERLGGAPNVELIEVNAAGLQEIASESVDVVYCTVVFMHLYEWDRYGYVVEAYRVLRPNGRCFFDNVDIASEGGWRVFMESYSIPPDRRPAHMSMVSTGDELLTYAQRAGFRDIKLHRWDNAWIGVTGIKK